jgi:aryl-alcohol dehydrogenase-like predicted oxidoreductase
VVAAIATETGHSPAQVALAWTLLNPAVTAPLLGARTLKQLGDNLGALEVMLGEEQQARLEAASAIELGFPHDLLRRPMMVQAITGGAPLPARRW